MQIRVSRELGIGIGVSALAVGAMAIDHLIGTEREPGESGAAEPVAFFVSTAIALPLAALLFVFVVRRADAPEGAAKTAIACSGLAVLTLPLLFLAVPFSFAGAGIALGLRGRDARRGLATAAIAIGLAVIALAVGAYVAALVA